MEEVNKVEDKIKKEDAVLEIKSKSDIKVMGWGKYRPDAIQKFASLRYFLACTSVLAMFSSALTSGYAGSVLTTIEKRFDISSTKASLLTAAYETGAVGFLSIVSYLGAKRNIPSWIASGVLLMACGAIVMVTPHLFVRPYHLNGFSNFTTDNICNPLKENQSQVLKDKIEKTLCSGTFNSNFFAILVLCCAQMMMGIGSTPILTLGPLYIDNHVTKSRAPSFISFIYAFGSVGPVIGFAIGACMMQIYVDFLSKNTSELTFNSTDPQWVGAWWGGYLILGGLLVCLTIPMYSFPKELKHEKEKMCKELQDEAELQGNVLKVKEQEEPLNNISDTVNVNEDEEEDYGKSLKHLPIAMWNLIKNPLFMITTLGIITEVFIVLGFIQFTPKYVENQFLLSKFQANIMTGLVPVPGCMFGILIGGYILRRFQLQGKGAIQLTLAINVVILMGFLVLFSLGCENTNMAGGTVTYFKNDSLNTYKTNKLPDLNASCNSACHCSQNDISMVCGINDITYFSPCHAGCEFSNFTDCQCVLEDLKASEQNNLTELKNLQLIQKGPCKRACKNFPIYLILLFGLTLLVGITQMPLLMIVFRSVSDSERSLALGIQLVFIRLLSNVPSPMVFARLIDRSCLLWKQTCGDNGMCLFYNTTHFRMNYIGLGGVVKALGFIIYCCVWALIIWQEKKEKKNKPIEDLNSVHDNHDNHDNDDELSSFTKASYNKADQEAVDIKV